MREAADIEQAIERHGNAVWRACTLYFGAKPDAQDAFQETMLRYATSDKRFADEEHRKAWLLRVAMNVCKDMLKAAHRANIPLDHTTESVAVDEDPQANPESRVHEVLEAFRALPDPPRTPAYLALYEGYTAPEISKMLDAPVNTVYSWVSRARTTLQEVLA